MNEHDFFTRYAELMKSIEPSEELVAATLARAKEQTTHSGRKTRFRKQHKPYTIAACFVAGALIVGGVGYAASTAGGVNPFAAVSNTGSRSRLHRSRLGERWRDHPPYRRRTIVFDRTHSQWTQTGEGAKGTSLDARSP